MRAFHISPRRSRTSLKSIVMNPTMKGSNIYASRYTPRSSFGILWATGKKEMNFQLECMYRWQKQKNKSNRPEDDTGRGARLVSAKNYVKKGRERITKTAEQSWKPKEQS